MPQGFAPRLAPDEFDAWYRGELAEVTDRVPGGLDCVPWDIGGPQPKVVELERAGLFHSDVLDVGCGLGDNALLLGERGYRVVGIDGAPTAIEHARGRVRAGQDVEFVITDATDLSAYASRFNTILDSGLYHSLDEQRQAQYLAAIYRATSPGAMLYLLCFSDAVPGMFPVPARFSEAHLRDSFARYWGITGLEHEASFLTAFTHESVQHLTGKTPPELDTDEHGRLLLPTWIIKAERK